MFVFCVSVYVLGLLCRVVRKFNADGWKAGGGRKKEREKKQENVH